jgi:hypothetical protein
LKTLVRPVFWLYIVDVITAEQIEAAMDQLPSAEKTKLRGWLLERTSTMPKTGAELAAIWPGCFHLSTQEADEFALDLEAASQSRPKAGWD